MPNDNHLPYIQICTLEAAREIDIYAYDGVITIENSDITEPFRVESGTCIQRVLTFDDIVEYLTSLVDYVTVIDLNSREYTETLGNDLSCLMSVEEAIDQARVTLLNTSPGFFGELVRAGFTTYP